MTKILPDTDYGFLYIFFVLTGVFATYVLFAFLFLLFFKKFSFNQNAFVCVHEFLILFLAPGDLSKGQFQNFKTHLNNTFGFLKFLYFKINSYSVDHVYSFILIMFFTFPIAYVFYSKAISSSNIWNITFILLCHYIVQFQRISALKIEATEGRTYNLKAHRVTCVEKKIKPKWSETCTNSLNPPRVHAHAKLLLPTNFW